MMDESENPAARLARVKQRVARAMERFGSPPEKVAVVAVSKTFPAASIRPLLVGGHRVFGENRVQEAQEKWPELKQEFDGVELHLIGPLQTNKVREAVRLFDVIETLDREKLARTLAREMQNCGRNLECFVQVNVGNERQKAGVEIENALEFVKTCRMEYGLNVTGLMCIPPFGEAPGPYFALLNTLAGQAGVEKLSMGMSADFELAIEMGATHVRVGSALFGQRDKPAP